MIKDENKKDNFSEDIRQFFFNRLENTTRDKYSAEYHKAGSERIRLFHHIEGILPEEEKGALLELDALYGLRDSALEEMIYTVGFADGMKFQRTLDAS